MAFANENILSGHGPEIPIIVVPQFGTPKVAFDFVDMNNPDSPVNAIAKLSDYDGQTYTTWQDTGGRVLVSARELWDSLELTFTATAAAVDAAAGKFSVVIPADGSALPGVYLMEYVLENKDSQIIAANQSYFEVQPSLRARQEKACMSVPLLRRMLRDQHPRANRVFEECQFSMAEIYSAVQMVIEEFNSEPPIMGSGSFTIATFPWPVRLAKAAVGELMKMAALWYERNNTRAQAAGVSYDDMNKAGPYMQIANSIHEEWINWVKIVKRQMNIQNGFSRVRSRVYLPYWRDYIYG